MTTETEYAINSATLSLFGQNSVLILEDSHFTTSHKSLINLDINKSDIKNIKCTLILFYSNNQESLELIRIWGAVASQTPGVVFSAVNLDTCKSVLSAFTMLNSINHSLYWARLQSVPFILIYNGAEPTAMYSGDRNIETIAKFALMLTCSVNF
uniref:Thioredoxin-like protein n=1 Tax=Pithovirus LCPAC404 TaxID=2506597 RepID=A0A481ZF76_9VIRU|nr:MAG: thioredoxin-like protein [Pithovirus LCPAC404]